MSVNPVSYTHNELFTKNCETGMAYTFWCKIDSWSYKYGQLKYILRKGGDTISSNMDSTTILQTNTSVPAIFLGNNSMDETGSDAEYMPKNPVMYFTFYNSSSDGYNEIYELTNIPLGIPFHIAISISLKYAEIYMDGYLLKTIDFENPLTFNYGDLHIGENDGYKGYISNLSVFPNTISSSDVYDRYIIGYNEEQLPNVCSPVTGSEETESSPSNDDLWSSIPYVLTENNNQLQEH